MQKLEILDRLKKQSADMEGELNAYGDLNPAKFDELKRAAFLAKEAAYRWTGTQAVFNSVKCLSVIQTITASSLVTSQNSTMLKLMTFASISV